MPRVVDSSDEVIEFAKLTGDFLSLSQADFQIVALAYQKVKAKGNITMLKDKPSSAVDFINENESMGSESRTVDAAEDEQDSGDIEPPSQSGKAEEDRFFFSADYDEETLKDLEEFAKVTEAVSKGLSPEDISAQMTNADKTNSKPTDNPEIKKKDESGVIDNNAKNDKVSDTIPAEAEPVKTISEDVQIDGNIRIPSL